MTWGWTIIWNLVWSLAFDTTFLRKVIGFSTWKLKSNFECWLTHMIPSDIMIGKTLRYCFLLNIWLSYLIYLLTLPLLLLVPSLFSPTLLVSTVVVLLLLLLIFFSIGVWNCSSPTFATWIAGIIGIKLHVLIFLLDNIRDSIL